MGSCCHSWCVRWILGCGDSQGGFLLSQVDFGMLGFSSSRSCVGCWSSQSSADGSGRSRTVFHTINNKLSVHWFTPQWFKWFSQFSWLNYLLYLVFCLCIPPSLGGGCPWCPLGAAPSCPLTWPCSIHHCILVAALGWLLLLCLSFQLCFSSFLLLERYNPSSKTSNGHQSKS